MKKILYLLLLLWTGPWLVFAQPVELSLSEAVNLAIRKNFLLKAASQDVEIGKAKANESHSSLEPNINLFYNWTRQLSPLGPPVRASFGTIQAQPLLLSTYKDGITLNQLLYDGEHTVSLFRQQEALSKVTQAQYRRLVQAITFETTQDFYALLAARKLFTVSQENLKNTEVHLQEAQANYKAGVAAKADVTFADVQVATAKLNLIKARQDEQNAQAVLNRTISIDVNTQLDLKGELSEKQYSIDLDVATKTALGNREEIKEATSVLESAQDQLKAARGLFYPQISAFSSYGYTDYGAKELPQNLGYSYGLQANFNLFSGNLQSSQVAEAKALMEKDKNLLESVKQDVAVDVKSAFLSFQSSMESVEQAKLELSKADENLQIAEGQYKAGVVSIVNLLDAQLAKNLADTHFVNALSDYNISMAKLKYSIGE